MQIFKLKMRHSLLQFGSMPALAPLLQGNRAILAGIIYISVHRGKKFRKVNQAESALGLIEKAKRLGFDKWFDIMKKEKAEQENNEQANN